MPQKTFRKTAVIGGTSGIARETVKQLSGLEQLVLVGRSEPKLREAALEVGRPEAALVEFRGTTPEAIMGLAESLPLDLDLLLVAQGMLRNSSETSLSVLEEMTDANFTLPALLIEAYVARRFRKEGSTKPLTIAAVSSVAGDRPRASNYWYGTTKAALSAFLPGLEARCRQQGYPVSVSVIKPGLVATRMIETRKDRRMVADPRLAGAVIARGLEWGKREIYVPGWWRWIMLGMKHLPYQIFLRVKS